MMVNSPLEIYGVVIGAEVYDSFFNILYSFGFVYLPLFFIALSGLKTLFENPYGHKVALGRAYWQLGGWMVAMMIAMIPIYPLNVDSVSYTPVCSVNATASTYGNTGTTYDNVLGDQSFPDINVPPLMAFFLEAFSGITNAGIVSLPCNTDVPAIQGTIDTTQLSPQLAQSVNRFRAECFSKASAFMTTQHPDPSTYQAIEKQYGGASDLGWVGSHVYQTLYYPDLYPSSPVPGFPYADFPYQYQSFNKQNADTPTPQWGFPSCEQWWNDSDFGIENQIVNSVANHAPNDPHLGDTSIVDEVNTWLTKIHTSFNTGGSVNSSDLISYSLLYDKGSNSAFSNNVTSNYVDDDGMDGGNDDHDIFSTIALTHGITMGLAEVGQDMTMMNSTIQRVEIQHEIEIMQAVFLTILISVGPIVLLAGNLRMGVIFTYFFLIASVIMVSFLEHLIHYMEMSIYASTGMTGSLSSLTTEYPYLYNTFTKLYQYAPFIYLAVMGWCGVAAGAGIQSMAGKSSVVGNSDGVAKKAVGLATAAML